MIKEGTNGFAALFCVCVACSSLFGADASVHFYGGTGFGGPNAFDLVEIDPSTGETTRVVDGTYWNGLDFTPDGSTLYAVSDNLYSIDIATGTYTEIGPLTFQGSDPIGVLSMTIAPDGQMYALSNSYSDPSEETRYYRIDMATGNLEYLGTPQGYIWAIEFTPDGTLYGAEFDLMILDPTDGSILETIGSLDSGIIVELDSSEDGNLYGTSYDDGLYQLDTVTGRATLMTPYSNGDQVWSLATKVRRDFNIKGISGAPQVIEWHSQSGENYQVWVSADLLEWISASVVLPASGIGINSWTDEGLHALGPPSDAQLRFYRIELLAPG